MGEVAQPPAVPLFVQEVEEGNSSDVLSLNAQLPGERSMRHDLGQVVPCDAGGVVVIVVGVELCWCWGRRAGGVVAFEAVEGGGPRVKLPGGGGGKWVDGSGKWGGRGVGMELEV